MNSMKISTAVISVFELLTIITQRKRALDVPRGKRPGTITTLHQVGRLTGCYDQRNSSIKQNAKEATVNGKDFSVLDSNVVVIRSMQIIRRDHTQFSLLQCQRSLQYHSDIMTINASQ
jgi:hypothetical protein